MESMEGLDQYISSKKQISIPLSSVSPSHSAFASSSLTGSKHYPIVLQKKKQNQHLPQGILPLSSSMKMEVLLPHSVPSLSWSQIKRAHLAFEWNVERSGVAPGSCEGLSSSPKVFSSAQSLSSLQGRAARVSLSTNVSYLTAGSRKTPTVPGFS